MGLSSKLVVAVVLVAFWCASANGQYISGRLSNEANGRPPLQFNKELSERDASSVLANSVFRPRGEGPFPAVVVAPTCGGVSQPHIRERMRELLEAGFIVLALESLGPRGLTSCRNQTVVRPGTVVMDAYAALEHLETLPIVSKSRIYLTGYSLGGVATPMLASPQSAAVFGARSRYRALVSNYGGCALPVREGSPPVPYLVSDTDTPILMLMASEDTEFKPADCFPLLEDLKAAGKPVEWHIYPNTHHAWDQRNQTGTESHPNRYGEMNLYLYNAEATRDSTKRMIEFFNTHR